VDADNSFSSGSHFVHSGYEMTDDEMQSEFSSVPPDLKAEECSEPAARVIGDELAASQPGHMSSCSTSRPSRSHTLVLPLICLPPLYTSSTKHKRDNIHAELSSGVTLYSECMCNRCRKHCIVCCVHCIC